MRKPYFHSLAAALRYIADEALRDERVWWQDLWQTEIDAGGGNWA